MPTLTISLFSTESFTDVTFDLGLFDIELISDSSTAITVGNEFDTSRTTILKGTGFSLDNSGSPTSGTVTSIEFYDNGSHLATMTGMNFSLVAFDDALFEDQNGNPGPLDALFDPFNAVFDATGVASGEVDFSDTELPLGDTAIAGPGGSFMQLGIGADAYVGGDGWDQISFRPEDGGTGVNVDLLAGTATDTYGNNESITGIIESVRGSQYDDVILGNNTYNMFRGLAGDDVMDGREGRNEVRYDRDANYGGMNGVTVNLETGVAIDGFGDTDTLSNFDEVRGSQFDDTIIGDTDDNEFQGLDGNDTLRGEDGNDQLIGGEGNDILLGGDGNDDLYGGNGNDTLNTGDNTGDDFVQGSTGNDQIILSDVNQTNSYVGIDYRDLLGGIVADINGVANTMTVDKGGDGFDTVTDVKNPLNAGSVAGGMGVAGSQGADIFNITNATNGAQWIQVRGYGGNDTFNINSGTVRLDYIGAASGIVANLATGSISNDGDGGSDSVNGTAWEIRGSYFADILNGSNNDESFISRGGGDTIDGAGGFDRVRYDRSDVESVVVNLQTGQATAIWDGVSYTDTLSNIEDVRGSREGDDTMTGDDNFNKFSGRGGDDTFFATIGGDELDGEDGTDSIRFDTAQFSGGAMSNLALDLGDGVATFDFSGSSHSVTFDNIENAIGGDDSDDSLSGSADDDMLSGLGGADRFVGYGGNDTFDGGEGVDTVSYDEATGAVNVYLQYSGSNVGSGEGRDTFISIENLLGSDFNDRLIGDANDNTFSGQAGNDVMKGKGGNDTFYGDAGDDRIRGDEQIDIIDGGDDDDILLGLSGNDQIFGGLGDDFLYGGKDADELSGGDGNDVLRGNRGGDSMGGGAGDDDLRGGGNGDVLNGGSGNDYLQGGGGSDTLEGGDGNDTLVGGFGSGTLDGLRDTFVYRDTGSGSGGGFDRIRDFEDGIDLLDLTQFGFADFNTLFALSSDSGANMRINFGGGDVLFIENFQRADFDASDVLIV